MCVVDRFVFHDYDAINWDTLVKDNPAVKRTMQSTPEDGPNPYFEWYKREVKRAERDVEEAMERLVN